MPFPKPRGPYKKHPKTAEDGYGNNIKKKTKRSPWLDMGKKEKK